LLKNCAACLLIELNKKILQKIISDCLFLSLVLKVDCSEATFSSKKIFLGQKMNEAIQKDITPQ
jgi:hypothetical protein